MSVFIRPSHTWLIHQLEAVKDNEYVCIVSHVPFLSASVFYWKDYFFKNDSISIDPRLVHYDIEKILPLLKKHNNRIKLCLSGHLHYYESIKFQDITFICSGAVSGAWWDDSKPNGYRDMTKAGYGIVDLNTDGTFDYTYETYS